MNVENEVKELRRWQRHWLLRQYGDNGQVLPENIKLSEALDAVLTELASMDRRAVIEACVAALKDKQKMLIDVGCDGPVVNAFSSAMGVIRSLADKETT